MAAIDFEKLEHDIKVMRINKRLFEEIFKIFDEFSIDMWESVRDLGLANIWCETLGDCREWYGKVDDFDELVKRQFINAMAERMCGYERERK
jgi:hypothetical protein